MQQTIEYVQLPLFEPYEVTPPVAVTVIKDGIAVTYKPDGTIAVKATGESEPMPSRELSHNFDVTPDRGKRNAEAVTVASGQQGKDHELH